MTDRRSPALRPARVWRVRDPSRRASRSWSPSSTSRPRSSAASVGCTVSWAPSCRSPGASSSPTTRAPMRRPPSPRRSRASCTGSRSCAWTARAAGSPCARPGRAATRACSATWTSTSPPTCAACSRWWRRWSRATVTSPIGTRLARSARVVRGPKRELISRSYNRLLRTVLRARFSDAQCGFKAVTATRPGACSPTSATTAGSSTPSCSCSPSAAACASTRSPSTGSTTPTRASTSCAPRSTTCAAWRAWRPRAPSCASWGSAC